VREADAHRVLATIAPADRVILDLPHSAETFLAPALRALGPVGVVHLYRILERADEEDAIVDIRKRAERDRFAVEDLTIHHVRAYSPTHSHVALDLRVARA